jgi:hypothetical protein
MHCLTVPTISDISQPSLQGSAMTRTLQAIVFSVALLAFHAGSVLAGPGHDHGAEAPASGGTGLPRFTAVSDQLELVGVLDGRKVTLYLDRFADNSPVPDARIELEIAGEKLMAISKAEGEYEVMLAAAPAAGVLPVVAMVTVGADSDLLAGELDLHAAAPSGADGHGPEWKAMLVWAGIGLSALLLVWAGVRVLRSRNARVRGAA